MSKKEKLKEFILSKEELNDFKGFSLRDLLSGRFLTKESVSKQLVFVIFLAGFAFVYIANHYEMESKLRQVAKMNKELKELRYEAITTSSELMFMSKQSEVLKKIHQSDVLLEELTEPPRVLKVNR